MAYRITKTYERYDGRGAQKSYVDTVLTRSEAIAYCAHANDDGMTAIRLAHNEDTAPVYRWHWVPNR